MTMTSEEAQYPINITPMSAQEARECIAAINNNLESLRLLLLELRRRRGWEVLGYPSWEDCAKAEFGKSRSYVFQLVAAAEVEENLAAVESTIVDWQNIPISHLTALAKLPPEKQAEGLLKAEEIAQAEGKKRNATHITQAIQKIEPGELAPTQIDEYLPTAATDSATDAEPGRIDTPTSLAPPPTTAQMLSTAVEGCLGDVTIPESLEQPLQGVVYVSPHQDIEQWSSKLLQAFQDGAVTEAIALLPLEHQVFIKFADYPLCPLDGYVAVYLGTRLDNFILCFADIGVVWHRYKQ